MRTLPFLLMALLGLSILIASQPASCQTVLSGKVTDESGEGIIGATVKVMKGTDFYRGATTDINGEYRIALDPGTYNIEFSYTGYSKAVVNNVVVNGGQISTLDQQLSSSTVLEEVVVTEYKVPLVQAEQTSGGQTLTSGQIRNLPGRSANTVVATTAGATSIDGGAIHIKGSRSNATTYYIDGMRVFGNTVPDASSAPSAKPAPMQQESKKRKEKAMADQDDQPGNTTRDSLPEQDNSENYSRIYENPFLPAGDNPVSTFSIDVDVASYANLRRFLNNGQMPPADAVRIEEMVNYFDYQYETPKDKHPFAVHTELAACPWEPRHKLMKIGLQGREIDTGQLPPSNFVFLIDVSGSMSSENKLPLVQQSLRLLVDKLRPEDRVAIVVYAGAAGAVLPSTSGKDKATIKAAIDRLQSGGSTAGAAGIELAYKIAQNNYARGGNNRVILCTDGDFNVGVSSESELVRLIEQKRESGVYLTVLGFGMGNYQDSKMQQLADKGNGNHAYIDQLSEAKKVLVSEFGGTLFAIAKDVKLQLEFNPAKVAGYRLIGYENRMLAKEDFDDDTKDAGELGAGHRVTALYEIVPAGQALPMAQASGDLKYQEVKTTTQAKSDELCTLKLRYKQPRVGAKSALIETVVKDNGSRLMSENFKLAAATASFGMLLRSSAYKGTATYDSALALAREGSKTDPNGYRKELCMLIEKARALNVRQSVGK